MHDLRGARLAKRLTQARAAERLGVSQSYLAMLEAGTRALTPPVARRVANLYRASPRATAARRVAPDRLARDLAALGYPGFAYLRPRHRRPPNASAVLLTALAQDDLESRVVEALPWLLLNARTVDVAWLAREARVRDLQNRLGFVVTLARQVAERRGPKTRARTLHALEATLDPGRLAREDTLCQASLPPAERLWLAAHRSAEARRWNLLTDWTAASLRHVA